MTNQIAEMPPNARMVYIATISRVNDLDRVSFSQVINFLVEENPTALKEQGVFKCVEGGIPQNHIINEWIQFLDDEAWWMPWMAEATEITLYIGMYLDAKEEIPEGEVQIAS